MIIIQVCSLHRMDFLNIVMFYVQVLFYVTNRYVLTLVIYHSGNVLFPHKDDTELDITRKRFICWDYDVLKLYIKTRF